MIHHRASHQHQCLALFVFAIACSSVELTAGDALSKLTDRKLQAIHDGVAALQATRQDVKSSGSFRQVRVNLHVHSHWSHDSRGQIEDIVEAARKVGTDVLMFTEHPAEHYDFFSDGHQGTRDGVLLIPGAEMQGFLVYPTMSLNGITPGSPQELSDLVRGRNGHLFVSHLEERMDWEIEGVSGVEIYNTHADFKEEKELISALKNPLRVYQLAGLIRKYPQECYSALQDYPADYLRKWDQLCQKAPHTGVSANDAHQNIGIAIRWIEGDNARIEDALGERIFDLNLNLVPGSQDMKKDKQPGDILFRMQLDPYENALRHVATHVLIPKTADVDGAQSLTVEAVRESLEAGRAFVAFDWIADSTGFEFWGERSTVKDKTRLELGDRTPWEPGIMLKAQAPLAVHWKLFRDGEVVSESDGREFSATADQAGVFRIEAWVSIDGDPMVWILSNPIYLNLPAGASMP